MERSIELLAIFVEYIQGDLCARTPEIDAVCSEASELIKKEEGRNG